MKEREQSGTEAAKRRRLFQLAGGIVLAAIVAVVLVVTLDGEDKDDRPAPKAGPFHGLPQDGPTLGEKDAPVTLVEFADLQCPFCRDYAVGVLPALVDKYVKTGRVRMEFRVIGILGPDSERAALFAEAAGLQDKLWQFTEAFFENQGQENTGYVTDDFLRRVAGEVPGLDVDKLFDDAAGDEAKRRSAAATALAERRGVNGTPAFFAGRTGTDPAPINPTALEGSAFEEPLDQLLGQ
ncbi:MAG: thioredoxin domain-containing protein [Thermoleophilaceae bacterium]|nr:thioredoxin domain-containing protein [Thermoleophilaceae bacterium]